MVRSGQISGSRLRDRLASVMSRTPMPAPSSISCEVDEVQMVTRYVERATACGMVGGGQTRKTASISGPSRAAASWDAQTTNITLAGAGQRGSRASPGR
jgi:hypothetical protein